MLSGKVKAMFGHGRFHEETIYSYQRSVAHQQITRKGISMDCQDRALTSSSFDCLNRCQTDTSCILLSAIQQKGREIILKTRGDGRMMKPYLSPPRPRPHNQTTIPSSYKNIRSRRTYWPEIPVHPHNRPHINNITISYLCHFLVRQ